MENSLVSSRFLKGFIHVGLRGSCEGRFMSLIIRGVAAP